MFLLRYQHVHWQSVPEELLRALREPAKDPSISPDVDKVGVKNVTAIMALDESGPGGRLAFKRVYECSDFEYVRHFKPVGYEFRRRSV
jgi:hypothetical protein